MNSLAVGRILFEIQDKKVSKKESGIFKAIWFRICFVTVLVVLRGKNHMEITICKKYFPVWKRLIFNNKNST